MKLIDEKNKLFFINGRVSELPVYWEAEDTQTRFAQIGQDGAIHMVYSSLVPEELTYFGLRSQWGNCGFYPKQGQLQINGQCLKLAQYDPGNDSADLKVFPLEGDIYYKRRILGDQDGNQQTMFSEIRFGNHSLTMMLHPNFEIIYSVVPEGEQK